MHKTTNNTAEEDNAVTSISVTSESNESIYITQISASYSVTATGAFSIKEDGIVIYKQYFDTTISIDFDTPFKLKNGSDLTIELDASGTAGTLGRLNSLTFKGE